MTSPERGLIYWHPYGRWLELLKYLKTSEAYRSGQLDIWIDDAPDGIETPTGTVYVICMECYMESDRRDST